MYGCLCYCSLTYNYYNHIHILSQGKLIGDAWKELGDDEKAPWQAKADKDKVRYQKDMEDYEP